MIRRARDLLVLWSVVFSVWLWRAYYPADSNIVIFTAIAIIILTVMKLVFITSLLLFILYYSIAT